MEKAVSNMQFIFTTTWRKGTRICWEADNENSHATKGEIKTKLDISLLICTNDRDLTGKGVINLNLKEVYQFLILVNDT